MYPAGKCRSTDGDKYAGAWEAGRRQGPGGCIFANGDRYQGQWAADLRHGKGACEYANGDVYQGGPSLKQNSQTQHLCTTQCCTPQACPVHHDEAQGDRYIRYALLCLAHTHVCCR